MFETSNDLRGFVADPQISRAPSSRDTLHYRAERSLLLSLFEHPGHASHTARAVAEVQRFSVWRALLSIIILLIPLLLLGALA